MKYGMKTNKMVLGLGEMSVNQLNEVAEALVWLDDAQAERLKNAIAVAQQERDLNELEKQKQEEMHSYDSDGWFVEDVQ